MDKLAKVYLKDNSEKCILIHIEIQGYGDRNFSQRMFTYYYRILDKYSKDITAIAIFTDSNKSYLPDKYEKDFYKTRITYEYRTYKVLTQNEDDLLKLKNPFGLVILSARNMIISGRSLEKRFAFRYDMMKRLLCIRNDEEIKTMAEELIMGSFSRRYYKKGLIEGELKGEIKGEQKGELKGKTESMRKVAANMLTENLPVEMISKVTGMSPKEISKIKKTHVESA